jgi:hypothetical protein
VTHVIDRQGKWVVLTPRYKYAYQMDTSRQPHYGRNRRRACKYGEVERGVGREVAPAQRLVGRRQSLSTLPATVTAAPRAMSGVLELQRLAGNRATVQALAEVGVAGRNPRSGLAIQRKTGFEVEGKTHKYDDNANVIVFDRASDVVDRDELGKIEWCVPERNAAGAPIGLRGYASEDEGDLDAVAGARRDAVRTALTQNGLTVEVTDLPLAVDEVKGNLDYRGMRVVIILDDASAAPPPAGDGRVHSTDKRYGSYGVAASLEMAQDMLEKAAGLVAALPEGPAPGNKNLALFCKYFATAKPSEVVERLKNTRAQIDHYKCEAPMDVKRPEGGHACLDWTGTLYINQGIGKEARLGIGADAKTLSPEGRAKEIVHEATHGAPELQTHDHSYVWQSMFPYLTPQQQFDNADSYAVLVALLTGLSQAPLGALQGEHAVAAEASRVETSGLSPEIGAVVKETWAWLEHYMVQTYLMLRDLYKTLTPSGLPVGTLEDSYNMKLAKLADEHFGIKPDEFAKFAGVIDRILDLKFTAESEVRFTATKEDQRESTLNIAVPADQIGKDKPTVMRWLLESVIKTTPSIMDGQRVPYADFIKGIVVMSKWGGPLDRSPE